jgi:hypothetical protein
VIKHFTFYYAGQPLQEADAAVMTDDLSQPDNSLLAYYNLPQSIVRYIFTTELKHDIKHTKTTTRTTKQVFLDRLH